MSKKEKSPPFYKKWWYYLILLILLFGNIAILLWADEAVKSYWLTLISGWISFIATITIGIIAFKQSRDYKEQNDLFIKEQKDMAWRESQYNHLSSFISQLMSFQNKIDRFILIKSDELYGKTDNEVYIERFKFKYICDFINFKNNINLFLKLSGLCFNGTEELITCCDDFFNFLTGYTVKKFDLDFINVATNKADEINSAIFKILADVEATRTIVYCKDISYAKQKIEEIGDEYNNLITKKK